MNLSDILILLAVAAAVVAAVLSIRRRGKTGKGCCGSSCESCLYGCPSRRQKEDP